jgi:hypothetical protein
MVEVEKAVVRENERVEEAIRHRKNEVNHMYAAHPCSHEVSTDSS